MTMTMSAFQTEKQTYLLYHRYANHDKAQIEDEKFT